MDDTTPRVIAGRYQLQKKLGSGAMGDVFLGHDLRLKRRVAVKVLDARWAESDDALQRVELEATAAAKLHSPHIVQIHDYGIEDENPYIVMEVIRGEDLRSRLKRLRRLSLADTAEVILQVAKALRVAHEHGIVHRDLKPANLMFDVSPDGEETLKVLDFGVAKSTVDRQDATTKAGALLGTPQYMAPEQARGMPDVDHRADLWSVGVLAYRALTGKLPFRGQSVPDTIIQICTTKAPPPTKYCPDLPPEVDEWFLTALATDRDDRFQSVEELTESFFIMTQLSTPSLSMPGSLTWGTLSHRGLRASRPQISSSPFLPEDEDDDEVTSVRSYGSFASAPSYPHGAPSDRSPNSQTLPTVDTNPDISLLPPPSSRGSLASASLGGEAVMIGDGDAPRVKKRTARLMVSAIMGLLGVFIGVAVALSTGPETMAKPASTAPSVPSPATETSALARPIVDDTPPPTPTEEPVAVTPTPSASVAVAPSASAAAEPAPVVRPWKPPAQTTDTDELFDDRY